MKKRALVSVSDKTGIVEFCNRLIGCGFEIISTGGSAKTLKDAGLPVIGISELTGFPLCTQVCLLCVPTPSIWNSLQSLTSIPSTSLP